VEVIIMSRNSTNTSLRVFNSIKHYGLKITRAVLASGSSLSPYLQAFKTDLFLSAYEDDVQNAINSGIAAGMILTDHSYSGATDGSIRIAFDGDAAELSLNGEPPARFGVDRWLFNPREEGRTLLEGEFFGNASLTPEGELKLLFRSSEVVYMMEFTIKFEAGVSTLVVDNGEEVRTFSEAQK